MEDEIKLWKEKTKGVFHIVEYKKFWYYITNLQQENKRLYELCMYALISSTKIYNHELAINTKQSFIKIIKENLQEDTFTIRDKIKKYWETGDSNE